MKRMRVLNVIALNALLAAWLVSLTTSACSAQTGGAATPQTTPVPNLALAPVQGAGAPGAASQGISGLLKPSLDSVELTVGSLKLEKWKKGSIRDEAGDNVGAILRDIKTNLPPLLSAADAAPIAASKALPVLRNIDALYDVLLRVNEAARVSAPADQVTQIDQALSGLQKGRLALADSLQDSVALMEKKASDLQARVDEQAATKCPAIVAPSIPTCAPAAKPKPKKKLKPPAAATPATQAPASTAPKPQG
jgi:hypothetical protein